MAEFQRPILRHIARGFASEACIREVLAVMRRQGRPMSYSLIKSRCDDRFTPAEIAASLLELIVERDEVSIDDNELYELEHP